MGVLIVLYCSFRYTSNGAVGLLTDKRTMVFATRGRNYQGIPLDTKTGFMRTVFAFLGIEDTQFVYAEGTTIGNESLDASIQGARLNRDLGTHHKETFMTHQTLARTIQSVATSDGAGVKLRRSIGTSPAARLDPFLMLDEFGTDKAEDYIAGFPTHPHRGFETVTYMLDGHMRHEDHMGNVGELTEGGVQWMTAGHGVIHSELPQQKEGRMRGFQLWINLPATEKMKPAGYKDIPASEIPVANIDGGRVKVIAGSFGCEAGEISGPIQGMTTAPVFFDVELDAGKTFETKLPATHSAFVYSYEGSVRIGEYPEQSELAAQSSGVLSAGDRVRITANAVPTRFVLLAGKPLNEPVVQHGPFVMNTREQIEQAILDYKNGTLVAA